MAGAYHPYVQEEPPLNIATNKRREREIEAHSYEATRPATIADLQESLLSSLETTDGSAVEKEEDEIDKSFRLCSGSLLAIEPEDASPNSPSRIQIYDDEYGPSSSAIDEDAELINEKSVSSLDRRESSSGPAVVAPHSTTEQHRDSFASVPSMMPSQDEGIKSTEDGGVDTIGPTSSAATDSSSHSNKAVERRFKRNALESHALGLNNLLTLKSRRKMRCSWRESSCDVMDYRSEIEIFAEDDDDGDGVEEENLVDRKHQRIPLPFGSYDDFESDALREEIAAVDKSTRSNHSMKSNLDEPVPVEIGAIKQMKKEDYWNLFERILHMPHDFVPEDRMEFIKRRDAARRSRTAAQAQAPKKKRNRDRQRRRKSFDYQMKTSGEDAVFEPPGHRHKRRSSFGGSTGQEREMHHHHEYGLLSKLPFMNVRFVRPKKPYFVAMMEVKTQELGRRAREATHSLSSKFHMKKIEDRQYDD